MGRTHSTDAIVLRAHDIGEADRLCILLTEDFGRIAARARAVRKLTSKNGGSILPLQYSTIDLAEGSAGYTVTRAVCKETHDVCRNNLACFLYAEQAVYLLMRHIEDRVPVPSLFVLLRDFLGACHYHSPKLLFSVFSLAFFHELGLLPSLRHSIVSHTAFTHDDIIVLSKRWHGLCLYEEDAFGRVLSPALLQALLHAVEHPFHDLSFFSSETTQEFISTAASLFEPGAIAPLPVNVGSSSGVTPTW
jgi:DNA repair protein RecO